MPSAGYSGTPLWKKLGLKEGCHLFASYAPKDYVKLLAPIPKGMHLTSRIDARTDIVHFFTKKRTDLTRALKTARSKMRDDATIWVSWPKQTSKVTTDITEDVIREVALPMGLVDVKVCAVDNTWSGLKLVVRKELRSKGD